MDNLIIYVISDSVGETAELDIPKSTISDFNIPLGSFPSSYLTANSIASTRLKEE